MDHKEDQQSEHLIQILARAHGFIVIHSTAALSVCTLCTGKTAKAALKGMRRNLHQMTELLSYV